MAKKKSVRGDFNMSSEIRNLLQENPKQTSRQVFEQLQARFPDQKVNRNSCNVAFSHARRRLGIRPDAKKAVKLPRPGARFEGVATITGAAVNFELLKAARRFLEEAGSSDAAISAIQQLEALQLN
ncbi:hypothetical protein SH668x_000802 [Planctomicrobium sp. SH668]|uniref:hypothetical protein n=1 Tax=Planctomicrobium sp. SH668 TaxID=3448126 RepID=UPI003F5C53EC